jgi:hypothetical protein
VHAYRKEIKDPLWQHQIVNDIPEIAKEGFNAIASNSNGQFMVIWLDLRGNKKNKLMSAMSKNDGLNWEPNKLIYASPDSTICECCQPNIIFNQNRISIMFRNWINGSRDMYTIHSFDEGKTFKSIEKQGEVWQKFYNINVSARLRPNLGKNGYFTTLNWQPRDSGLLEKVTLIPVEKE